MSQNLRGSGGHGLANTVEPPPATTSAAATPLFPWSAEGVYGYIGHSGEWLIRPDFDDAGPFQEDFAKVAVPRSLDESVNLAKDQIEEVTDDAFIDRSGKIRLSFKSTTKVVTVPPYTLVSIRGNFSNGRALVGTNLEMHVGGLGYIDKAGHVAIPPDFVYADDFSEGRAAVVKLNSGFNTLWGYIDLAGAMVIPATFAMAKDFSEGLAAVKDLQSDFWGFVDKSGAYVLRPQFLDAWSFSEGYAVVETAAGRVLIDRTGAVKGDPAPAMGRFSQGLAAINVGGHGSSWPGGPSSAVSGGLWGYRDAAGHMVIPPTLTFAAPFSEGLAAANVGGRVFDSVDIDSPVDGGKWGYLNPAGEWKIRPEFGEARAFQNGLAEVEGPQGGVSQASFYIDAIGRRIETPALAPGLVGHGLKGLRAAVDKLYAHDHLAQTPGIQAVEIPRAWDGAFPSLSLLTALAPSGARSKRTIELSEVTALRQAFKEFLAHAPAGANKDKSRPAATPSQEAVRDRDLLRADFRKCRAEGESEVCALHVALNDYENIGRDPYLTPVSAERARYPKFIDDGTRAVLEKRLTEVMGFIRLQALKSRRRGESGAPELQPVAVTINPSSDLNVTAAFGSKTLAISEAMITSIYFRALHRAILDERLRESQNSEGPPCGGPPESEDFSDDHCIFVTNFARLAYLDENLPSIRVHILPSHWLAHAVLANCNTLDLEARAQFAKHLATAPNQDARSRVGLDDASRTLMERFLSCAAPGASARALNRVYMKEYAPEVINAENEGDLPIEQFSQLVEEKTFLDYQLSFELIKSLYFIMAHEAYHIWLSPMAGREAELAADAFAIRTYYASFGKFSLTSWISRSNLSLRVTVEESGSLAADPDWSAIAASFEEISSRDPIVLLKEVYLGSPDFEGNRSHPPILERVRRIQALANIHSYRQACHNGVSGALPLASWKGTITCQ